MTDLCPKCGGEVIKTFAGATEILRHRVAPADAHYPRVPTTGPRPGEVPPRPATGGLPRPEAAS